MASTRTSVNFPAVLELGYTRFGAWHQLFLAFDLRGRPMVSLRIASRWSGWHGEWCQEADGRMTVKVHHAGAEHLVRPFTVWRMGGQRYLLCQGSGEYIVMYARIVTLLITQQLLQDRDAVEEWQLL